MFNHAEKMNREWPKVEAPVWKTIPTSVHSTRMDTLANVLVALQSVDAKSQPELSIKLKCIEVVQELLVKESTSES